MSDIKAQVLAMGARAKAAALELVKLDTAAKNRILESMAAEILARQPAILEANAKDVAAGVKKGLTKAMIDRLRLTEKGIAGIASGIRKVVALPDPVGEILAEWTVPSGIQIQKKRVPIGTIGIIFESRPNVTSDAAVLCFKSGNATILRGGSEAIHSNVALAAALTAGGERAGMPPHAIQLIPFTDRESVRHMAETICLNAKCQKPGVCNAMETLLVDAEIVERFLRQIAPAFRSAGVELRGDETVCKLLSDAKPATEEDWRTEYLDLILSVRVVPGLQEAIDHVNTYGSRHSDSIVTRDTAAAERFLNEVDSATVYVNASTRFTDGEEFGFGAEIGISTDKLHARGPMALPELTSYKYLIRGTGQVRG